MMMDDSCYSQESEEVLYVWTHEPELVSDDGLAGSKFHQFTIAFRYFHLDDFHEQTTHGQPLHVQRFKVQRL